MIIAEHRVVSFQYKVVDDDSEQLIDSSENSDPMAYLHAAQNIIRPLAGKRLRFKVTVEAVREATDEEISHGHVHGPGGHDHG